MLLDTMILCYAFDSSSHAYEKAKAVLTAALLGYLRGYVSYQNLAEFYSVMTSRRVKSPLAPNEALKIVRAIARSRRITKLLPANFEEAIAHVARLNLKGGEVFDAILAYTCKGVVDYIWTENVEDFKHYGFLVAENPLEWEWEVTE